MKLDLVFCCICLVIASLKTSVFDFPNDLKRNNLSGPIKSYTEHSLNHATSTSFEDTYHFNEEGFITHIDHYNHRYVEQDSLALGEITFFEKVSNTERNSKTISVDDQQVSKIKKEVLVNDSTLHIYTKSITTKYELKTIHIWDKDYKILSSTTTGKKWNDMNNSLYSKVVFSYRDNQLVEMKVSNDSTRLPFKKSKVTESGTDEFGNFLKREYFDSEDGLQHTVTRSYEYY